MLRSIIWYLAFPITLLLFLPKMFTIGHLNGKMDDEEFNKLVEEYTSQWVSTLVKISGAKVDVQGLENIPEDGAVLFVSNHQSNFDTALFLAFIHKPKGYIAKSELLKIPLLRTWMKHLNCVFIDRKDMKNSLKGILKGIEILKSGHSMVVFPEGTRSKSDNLGEFKSGSFKLATKPQVPIIPVTISGSYKLMEENNNKIKPAPVKMVIHQPIIVKDLAQEELVALPNRVKEIIKSAL